MKKIYLICSNGMSTSMLASMMQASANKHQLPIEIKAYPQYDLERILQSSQAPDIILLGPQVQYMFDEIKKQYEYLHIPIIMINQEDYGMLNGEKILKQAILAIKKDG